MFSVSHRLCVIPRNKINNEVMVLLILRRGDPVYLYVSAVADISINLDCHVSDPGIACCAISSGIPRNDTKNFRFLFKKTARKIQAVGGSRQFNTKLCAYSIYSRPSNQRLEILRHRGRVLKRVLTPHQQNSC